MLLFDIFFGIGRFITNQQNIYRVTPVHYLQKAEKKTLKKPIQYRRGEKRIHGNHFCLLSAAPVNHDQAVQLIFVFNGLLLSTNSMFYIHESD